MSSTTRPSHSPQFPSFPIQFSDRASDFCSPLHNSPNSFDLFHTHSSVELVFSFFCSSTTFFGQKQTRLSLSEQQLQRFFANLVFPQTRISHPSLKRRVLRLAICLGVRCVACGHLVVTGRAAMNTPFVYWAQDEKNVFLRVDIRDAENVEERAESKIFALKALGTAANGNGSYGFELGLFGEIHKAEKDIQVKPHGSNINVILKKRTQGFWPSLTADKAKLNWLKIDFDRWIDPDAEADAEEERKEEALTRQRREDFAQSDISGSHDIDEMTRRLLQKNGNIVKSPEQLQELLNSMFNSQSLYLCFYNVIMYLIHLFVVLRIGYGLSTRGLNYVDEFWHENVAWIRLATTLQYVDVAHAILGMTKSGYQAALVQVSGRLAMTYILAGCDHLTTSWTTLFLVLDWFAIECFRYPYYALSVIKIENYWATWLRYSAWIPLYPTGLTLEFISMARAIPLYYSTGQYGFEMPNFFNMSFNFGVFLAVFLIGVFPFIAFYLLSHMKHQRAKKMVELCKKKA
ncbi:hypothetical protein L596_020137 [Steinernema carpocapsae]|uniref:Very-long-chain (3R)-3-hydroxyacyl-CoA dehydratase n=1 Tax=Steinernema carpocapsae TaxID=34508 RepID=A0A4U5MSN4_STECR|nr:hypothetical protein L596_020137 [Steinernema carpocapsae]